MILVNLFGGPGTGKSTAATYIFSQLKLKGINAELVTEVAKDRTWENNTKALDCQLYILGNQVFRIDRCKDDVDIIITDSPILLSPIYNKDKYIEPYFTDLVMAKFQEYNNENFFLKRVKPYNPKGRNQNEDEAKQLDFQIKDMLNYLELDYHEVVADEEGYKRIVDFIINKYFNK